MLQSLYEYHNKQESWGQIYQGVTKIETVPEYLFYGPDNSQVLNRWDDYLIAKTQTHFRIIFFQNLAVFV